MVNTIKKKEKKKEKDFHGFSNLSSKQTNYASKEIFIVKETAR